MGRSVTTRLGLWAGLLVVAPVVLARVVPGKSYDRGIFISVAERLRSGDRLYADVWDNKDPLFYWALAIGRSVGPFGDVALEFMWLSAACLSIYGIGRWSSICPGMAALLACVAAPLLFTGAFYAAGLTHLPGIAATLAALCACLWNRRVLTGTLLAVVAFLKLPLLPLAVALILIASLRTGRKREGLKTIASFCVTATALLVALQMRGELDGFIGLLGSNFRYAQSDILIDPDHPITDHLRRSFGVRGAMVSGLVLLAITGSMVAESRGIGESAGGAVRTLRELTGAALVAGIATLALTGMWNHHAQILYLAGVLCLTLVTRQFLRDHGSLSLAGASLVLLAALISGFPGPRADLDLLLSAQQRLRSLAVPSPETVVLLQESSSGLYARIGMHDDLGHAEGLAAWTLLCPRFHQYPFDPPQAFGEVLGCVSKAPYLLVSDSASPREAWGDEWNRFIEDVETLLDQDFVCHAYPGGRLCLKELPE